MRAWLAKWFGKHNTWRYSVQSVGSGCIVTSSDNCTLEMFYALKEHANRIVDAPVGARLSVGFDLWAVRIPS